MARPDITLTPQERDAFLRGSRTAALATMDKDGFPHLVAMRYLFKDGAFYMTSYGRAQKVANIRRNARVAVMVEAGESYADVRGVAVRGTCEIIDDPAAVAAILAEMRQGQRISAEGQRNVDLSAGKRVILKVVPQKSLSWDFAKLRPGR